MADTVGVSPPPGIVPNFDNPESIAYRLIVVSVVGPVVTIPMCGLRLYTNRRILRLEIWDDCEFFELGSNGIFD
jgi:hypothetical protein